MGGNVHHSSTLFLRSRDWVAHFERPRCGYGSHSARRHLFREKSFPAQQSRRGGFSASLLEHERTVRRWLSAFVRRSWRDHPAGGSPGRISQTVDCPRSIFAADLVARPSTVAGNFFQMVLGWIITLPG